MTENPKLLRVRDLQTHFHTEDGVVRASLLQYNTLEEVDRRTETRPFMRREL